MKAFLIAIAVVCCIGAINRQQPKAVDLSSLPDRPNGVYQVQGKIEGMSNESTTINNGYVSLPARNEHSYRMPNGASITIVKNGNNLEIVNASRSYIGLQRISIIGNTAVGTFSNGSVEIINK
jgi:hypothetical protein